MENGEFTFEAGTPPDYFNSDGQKWNSPVYNVSKLKKDKYKYLVKRFKYYLELFDKVRIDYFRGYDSFFKIPIGKTGREGCYADGVSYGFFDELFKDKEISIDKLIIEDLGDIREETVKLREHYGFTRQKILEFTIDLDNLYDRDNESENVLVLPGTHDCSTVHGWYKQLSDWHKERLKEFLRNNECYDINVNIGIMQYCMKCKAKMAIIAAQDILGVDDSCRMNLPGTDIQENWSWKLINFDDFKERIKDFK
jgi:4-alpha-glucanotransferase